MMTSVKKCHVIFKMFLLLLWKFLVYLECEPSFKSINSSSLSKKGYDGDYFTPTPYKGIIGQICQRGIWLIELIELSDTLNYKPDFKHNIAFCKLFCTYFYCLYLCGTKSCVLKLRCILHFDLVWVGIQCYSI